MYGDKKEPKTHCIRSNNVPTKQNSQKSQKKKFTKRGPGKKSVQAVPIFSANCAGCYNKTQSLVDNVSHLGAGIFTLQETHFKSKGKLNNKFSDFEVFEAIRPKLKLELTP